MLSKILLDLIFLNYIITYYPFVISFRKFYTYSTKFYLKITNFKKCYYI